MLVTNQVANPEFATDTAGWTLIASVGTPAGPTRVTDPDLATAGEFASSAASTIEAKVTNAGTRIACRQRELIHVRAKAKPTAGAGKLGIVLYFYNSAGSLIDTSTALIQTPTITVGQTYDLEGFHTAPDGTTSVWPSVYFISSSAPTLRVTKIQVSVDHWGDVPTYTSSSAQTSVILPAIWGPNDNPFQWADPELTYARHISIAKSCGANAIRFALTLDNGSGFPAADPQTSSGGVINWQGTVWGKYLDAIEAAGMRALPIVFQCPAWMDSERSLKNLGSQHYAALGALYADLVQRWNCLVGIEFMNEPNLSFFWNFNSAATANPNPEKYVAMLEPVYEAIKAVAPDLPVIAGALSHRQTSTSNNLSLIDFLDRMDGFESYADAVSVHPYASSNRSGNTSPVGDWGAGVWGAVNQVRERTSLPIWATEFGYPVAQYRDERWAAQVNALTRGMLDRAGIEAVFVHGFVREFPGSALSEPYATVRLPAEAYLGAAQTLGAE